MDPKNKELTDQLVNLIDLNKQRRDGYEKAMIECKGHFPEYRLLFGEFADESREFITMLSAKVQDLEARDASSAEGEISRMWNHVKWAFTGIDKEGILRSCEEAEAIIIKGYEKVLDNDAEMSAETRQMLLAQKEALQADAARIHTVRNGTEAVAR